MEFFHRATNFPFMSTRKVWYALSAVMILVSAGSLVLRAPEPGRGLHGRQSECRSAFRSSANRDAVANALKGAGYVDPQVTIFGSARDVADLAAAHQAEHRSRPRFRSSADAAWPGCQCADSVQVEVIGPQVGGELLYAAPGRSMGATLDPDLLVYIIFRFHTWRLSSSAPSSRCCMIRSWCLACSRSARRRSI